MSNYAIGSATPLSILRNHNAPLLARVRIAYWLWRIANGPILNISCRKVGGLRFLKLGRFTLMFCVSKEYRPL